MVVQTKNNYFLFSIVYLSIIIFFSVFLLLNEQYAKAWPYFYLFYAILTLSIILQVLFSIKAIELYANEIKFVYFKFQFNNKPKSFILDEIQKLRITYIDRWRYNELKITVSFMRNGELIKKNFKYPPFISRRSINELIMALKKMQNRKFELIIK